MMMAMAQQVTMTRATVRRATARQDTGYDDDDDGDWRR